MCRERTLKQEKCPVNIYLVKFNIKNTRAMCEFCSKLTCECIRAFKLTKALEKSWEKNFCMKNKQEPKHC